MKLAENAQIMIGVLTKREYDENGKNSYMVFSLKSYEEGQPYEELKTNKNLSDKLTRKGDLLFRLLYPNKIIYIDDKMEGKLVPSQFCIIRPYKEKMDSKVLKWLLESSSIKKELEEKVTGSIIKSMKVSTLQTLDIPHVSLENQSKMKELITLWEKEKKYSKEILEQKDKLYNIYLEELIRGS